MVKYISLLLFIGLAWGQVDTLWTNTFGGSSSDYGYCVKQTTDGGYINTIRWDGRDKIGLKVPTVIYFYRFDTSAFSDVKKMIYLK